MIIKHTFSETLYPGQPDYSNGQVSGPYSGTVSYTAANSYLAYWIGTGTLAPDVSYPFSFATASDPSITVRASGLGSTISGTETITYVYGVVTPEPASFVMLSLGLAAVGGIAWRRRAA